MSNELLLTVSEDIAWCKGSRLRDLVSRLPNSNMVRSSKEYKEYKVAREGWARITTALEQLRWPSIGFLIPTVRS